MALFTDQSVSEISDLIAYEANLPEISSAEGIDLETKIRLAQTELLAHLEAASQRPGNVYFAQGAGWQSTGGEANLSRFALNQVVVTPPLKLWHTFQALAIIYRDAYNRKLNDKYLPGASGSRRGSASLRIRFPARDSRRWIGLLRLWATRRCLYG